MHHIYQHLKRKAVSIFVHCIRSWKTTALGTCMIFFKLMEVAHRGWQFTDADYAVLTAGAGFIITKDANKERTNKNKPL